LDSTVTWSTPLQEDRLRQWRDGIERKIFSSLPLPFVQPFGVISANDRAKRMTSSALRPAYQCLLEAAMRSARRPDAHCPRPRPAEQLIAIDPNFANGFTLFAAFHAREP